MSCFFSRNTAGWGRFDFHKEKSREEEKSSRYGTGRHVGVDFCESGKERLPRHVVVEQTKEFDISESLQYSVVKFPLGLLAIQSD